MQPMIPRDMPDTPWQDLAADFFTYKTNDYLLVADTFSKYPFTYKMHKKTAETVIHKLTQLFSQYSTPKHLSTGQWTTIQLRTLYKVPDQAESRSYNIFTALPQVKWIH